MRKNLFIILFTIGFLGFAQDKQQALRAKIINNGVDFSDRKYFILLKSINERNQFFGVNNLVIPQNKEIYRFWDTRYCIEVEKSGDELAGQVIYAIQNLPDDSKIFRKKFLLNEEQTKSIFNLIKEYDIEYLPTDYKIEDWTSGLDGNTFDIESNVNKIYTYKSYWTPSMQNIRESKLIVSFFEDIKNIINADDLTKIFDLENIFSSYRYWGVNYSVLKILTKKEIRKLKKNKRKIKEKTAHKRRSHIFYQFLSIM